MPHAPADFHDILENHDFERDVALTARIDRSGSILRPIATKQCSISAAHTKEDIRFTLDRFEDAVSTVWPRRAART